MYAVIMFFCSRCFMLFPAAGGPGASGPGAAYSSHGTTSSYRRMAQSWNAFSVRLLLS